MDRTNGNDVTSHGYANKFKYTYTFWKNALIHKLYKWATVCQSKGQD